MAMVYPGEPTSGSIFMGDFVCEVSKNVRVKFWTWPTLAYLESFTTGGTCSQSYNMTQQSGSAQLTMEPGVIINSCNESALGFEATLDSNNMSISGYMTLSGKCDSSSGSTLTMARQIGFEIASATDPGLALAARDYTLLSTCTGTSSAYQYSRVVFRPGLCNCDPETGDSGCMMQNGGTEVTLPGYSDIWAFTLPAGTSNFELNIKGDDTDISAEADGTKFPYPLGLTFVPSGNTSNYTMWFVSPNLVSKNLVANLVQSGDKSLSTQSADNVLLVFGQVTVNCTRLGNDANTIGGSCKITPKSLPESLAVYVSLRPPAGETTELRSLVTYSYYMWRNCTEFYPVDVTSESQCEYGCCPKNSALAQSAVQYWARQQRVLGLSTSKAQMQNYGLTSTQAGIPFYRWQAAWNKALEGVGGWDTDWSGYWALAFSFLDKNDDGYIVEAEYQDGYNVEVGVCPSGYMQTNPIVMSCNAISGTVSFSLQDDAGNNSVKIPAGVRNLYLRFSSTASIQSMDLRIEDPDPATPRFVVSKDFGVPVNENNTVGSFGSVNITLLYGQDASTNSNYYSVQFTGTLDKEVIARVYYQTADNIGTYDFSTDGVANCPADTIYQNACTEYNEAAAALAVQVWSTKLSDYASADLAWKSTEKYRLLNYGEQLCSDLAIVACGANNKFLSRGMFNQYWFTIFTGSRRLLTDLEFQDGAQSHNRGDEEYEFESSRARRLAAYSQSLRGSALQAFRYADTNNDGYLSQSEFTAIYSSVLTCGTQEYQAAMMLLGCSSLQASIVVTIESGVSLPVVIVPPGMTGFALTASSSLHMKVSMKPDELTASPSSFSTSTPESAATSNISYTGNANPSFTVSITTQGGSNKSIEVSFQGTTVGNTTWLITNNDTSTGTITLNYSFTGLSSCSSTPSGCLPFNQSYADSLLQAWSSRVSGPDGFSTSAAAWTNFAPQQVLFNSIPLSTFPKVWCNDTTLDAGCPGFLIGFKAMDANNDLLISLSEVTVAYALSSVDLLDVSALTDGCSITTRYQQTEFPISQMANIESCHCSTKLAEGWDNEQQECMKRRVTACSQCTHQEKCATITTYVGSGLQEFLGDCPRNAPQNECSVAQSASFSYPVSLAVDEEDNVYVSDHGNNRVRMVNVATDLVLTIAGTGEVGFSGDGGDGIYAKLRHPEGIAVNHLLAPPSYGAPKCSSPQPRRVYFSDFYNQRVRVLEKDSATGAFMISTLVGTGVRGENPDCDAGCLASDAILHYPRALALTRWGDLFIVDSGNRKIRLLSADGNVRTFLGSGSVYHSENIVAMRMKGGALLSGSWEEDNLDVLLNSVYTIQLDKEDNLWVVDGTNNRLLMAPLDNKTINHTRGYIGRYAAYFKLHFGQLKNEDTMVQNMAQWLRYEMVDGKYLYTGGTTPVSIPRGQRQAGKTSWKHVNPEPGHWCEPTTRPDRCLKTQAQFTKFQRTMGLCFDAGNLMYVVDQEESQVMKVSSDPMITVRATDDFSAIFVARVTAECPCLSHWVDWVSMGRNPTEGGSLAEFSEVVALQMRPYEMCDSSPRVVAMGLQNIPEFLQVPCSVTQYCSSTATPMCFINTTTKKHGSDCYNSPWSFCPEEALPEITFKNISLTSLLGHEIRQNNRCTAKKKRILEPCDDGTCKKLADIMISWGERQLMEKFSCSDNMFVFPFTMLLGFQEPKFVQPAAPFAWTEPMRPSNCSIPCCGLENKTDSVGSYCAINSEADYTEVFLQYVNMLNDTEPNVTGLVDNSDVKLALANEIAKDWYGIVLVWSSLKTQSAFQSDCEQACRLDPECKAYVWRQGSDTFVNSNNGYACTTYSETWPYNIFIYNRSKTPPTWGVQAKSVYSRLFNFEAAATGSDSLGINNAYVNTLSSSNYAQPMGYISGPSLALALDFHGCQQLCQQDDNCTSIAYPGCYLFNYTPSYWESIEQTAGDPRNTTVFVKEHVSVKVSGVTGSPSVKAYSDDVADMSEAIPALVNRPSGCALDSSGNVLLADTWNHRIRKLSKLHVGCQYNMDLFTKDDVREYRDAINNMEELCFGQPCDSVGCRDAPFYSSRQTMQYELLQNLQQGSVDALCNSDQTVIADGINTKNLQVLCDVCSPHLSFGPRPATCPTEDKCCQMRDKCNCRASIVRVLATKVYLNCPDQSAYYEKWHKFVTAYAACWMLASQKDTMFLGNNSVASRKILERELVVVP